MLVAGHQRLVVEVDAVVLVVDHVAQPVLLGVVEVGEDVDAVLVPALAARQVAVALLVVEGVARGVHALVDLVRRVGLVEVEVELQLLLAEVLGAEALCGLDPGEHWLLLVLEGGDLGEAE